MNKKKIERAATKNKYSVWLGKYGYIVKHIVLWFIWIPICLYEKLVDRKRKAFIEKPNKTKRLLDKVFPKMVVHYCSDINVILIMFGYHDGMYADFCTHDFTRSRSLSKRQRQYFAHLSDERIKQLIADYEIDGYEKMVLSSGQDWDIAAEKFEWETNCNKDIDRAVVFYSVEKYGHDTKTNVGVEND